jgi:hypothetical protein
MGCTFATIVWFRIEIKYAANHTNQEETLDWIGFDVHVVEKKDKFDFAL